MLYRDGAVVLFLESVTNSEHSLLSNCCILGVAVCFLLLFRREEYNYKQKRASTVVSSSCQIVYLIIPSTHGRPFWEKLCVTLYICASIEVAKFIKPKINFISVCLF